MKHIYLPLLLVLASCLKTESYRIKEYKEKNQEKKNAPLADYLFADMHGLSLATMRTNAVPLKLAMTAVLLQKQESDPKVEIKKGSLKALFTSWGFFYSQQSPKGWDESEKLPQHEFLPYGVEAGEILGKEGKERIEIMNINCSTCHTGTGYDESGRPTLRHTPGLPNTSLNLDNFLGENFAALVRFVNDKTFRHKTFATIPVLFPEVTKREMRTLKLMFPLFRKAIRSYDRRFGGFMPVNFGGAGLSNAIALFKSKFKSKVFTSKDPEEASYVSIPALYRKGLRTALLVDGSTAPLGDEFAREMTWKDVTPEHINKLAESAVYFPMLVSGVSQKGSIEEIERLQGIVKYFTYLSPEKFPGKIDQEKAERGRKTFSARCASCHGSYEGELLNQKIVSYPNKVVPQEKIGTDEVRLNVLDEALVEKLEASLIAKYFSSKRTGGYVPPMLNAVWATAPYLHNGSVPTLWDLMHPEQRPITFKVGGHMLDFEKVGISFPEGYAPWTQTSVYNTKDLGKSNKGHEFPFKHMSEEEKRDVLEYLKLL